MNWDALGAIAELVGALGVIASLLYLAGQVRGSTRAAAVAAKLESTGLLNKFIDLLIENPVLNDIRKFVDAEIRGTVAVTRPTLS